MLIHSLHQTKGDFSARFAIKHLTLTARWNFSCVVSHHSDGELIRSMYLDGLSTMHSNARSNVSDVPGICSTKTSIICPIKVLFASWISSTSNVSLMSVSNCRNKVTSSFCRVANSYATCNEFVTVGRSRFGAMALHKKLRFENKIAISELWKKIF